MDNSKIVPCDTCAITVNADGSVSHEPDCLRQEHHKLKGALHKIGHVLKEAGIIAAETAVEVAAPPNFGGSDN